jgi:hypothetical protein
VRGVLGKLLSRLKGGPTGLNILIGSIAVLENTSSVRSRKWGNRFMNSYAMRDTSTCLVNQANSTPPGDESCSQYVGKCESKVLSWLLWSRMPRLAPLVTCPNPDWGRAGPPSISRASPHLCCCSPFPLIVVFPFTEAAKQIPAPCPPFLHQSISRSYCSPRLPVWNLTHGVLPYVSSFKNRPVRVARASSGPE